MSAQTLAREVIWHDVECGAYAADLPVWAGLAREATGPVLELGAGTGRVALHLARAGLEVAAIDDAPLLAAELNRRAASTGLDCHAEVGDVRELSLGREFAAILAPMQLVHLLGGQPGRAQMLAAARAHLRPGGVLAAALLDPEGVEHGGTATTAALPDVREIDGWVYSSLPVGVRSEATGIEVRRLRQVVSPAGDLREELDVLRLEGVEPGAFEHEAAALGYSARERLAVTPTDEHVGSVVCVLEAR